VNIVNRSYSYVPLHHFTIHSPKNRLVKGVWLIFYQENRLGFSDSMLQGLTGCIIDQIKRKTAFIDFHFGDVPLIHYPLLVLVIGIRMDQNGRPITDRERKVGISLGKNPHDRPLPQIGLASRSQE